MEEIAMGLQKRNGKRGKEKGKKRKTKEKKIESNARGLGFVVKIPPTRRERWKSECWLIRQRSPGGIGDTEACLDNSAPPLAS